jgi:D-alanyl-D-alanine carboxypeptidase
MNSKAKKIGLAKTRFSNPHGLQNAFNVSTAKDILVLSKIASGNKKFKSVMNSIFWRYEIY